MTSLGLALGVAVALAGLFLAFDGYDTWNDAEDCLDGAFCAWGARAAGMDLDRESRWGFLRLMGGVALASVGAATAYGAVRPDPR